MNIWEYDNYKAFVRAWITEHPTGTRGKLKEMAGYLRVHNVVMSQVFNGPRDLSLEHAFELTKYLGLVDQKKRYFLLLVQYARAGSKGLQEELRQQLDVLRIEFNKLTNRLESHKKINDQQSAKFYSSWTYSAIRLASELKSVHGPRDLEQLLGIPPDQVLQKLSFLLKTGLVIETDGGLNIGQQRTHVASSSPWVNNHHRNWRERGLQAREKHQDTDLFVTAPHTLSDHDFNKIRENILQFTKEQFEIISSSEVKKLACLNIDFFEV